MRSGLASHPLSLVVKEPLRTGNVGNRYDGNTATSPAQKWHSSGPTNVYSFSTNLLNTHHVQGIVLGAAVFEMTKLFVYVASELFLDSLPDLREKDRKPLPGPFRELRAWVRSALRPFLSPAETLSLLKSVISQNK